MLTESMAVVTELPTRPDRKIGTFDMPCMIPSRSCLLENCGAQREMGLADLPSVFVIVYPAVDMFCRYSDYIRRIGYSTKFQTLFAALQLQK